MMSQTTARLSLITSASRLIPRARRVPYLRHYQLSGKWLLLKASLALRAWLAYAGARAGLHVLHQVLTGWHSFRTGVRRKHRVRLYRAEISVLETCCSIPVNN